MKVVYEDNHLIIVNKDPGELSQSDYTKDQSLVEKVKNYLKIKYQKKGNVFLGLVNRLDRPTSGLLIFSKSISFCILRSYFFGKIIFPPFFRLSRSLFGHDSVAALMIIASNKI